MSTLEVVTDKLSDRLTVLRLRGEFEGTAVLDAKEKLLACFDGTGGASDLAVDFAEISYIDSSGIGVLLEMAKKAAERRLRFGLLNVNEPIQKVLAVTRVDKILTRYDS